MSDNTKETPRLVKWANDNYPPIDLNSQHGSVIALINSYTKLKEENEKLKGEVVFRGTQITALNTLSLKQIANQNELVEALGPLANLDMRGVTGEMIYQRNNSTITVTDVNKAKEAINKCITPKKTKDPENLTDRLLNNPQQEEEDYNDFLDAAYPDK